MGKMTWKSVALVALRPITTTLILPVPAPAGTVATRLVVETDVTIATTSPKSTWSPALASAENPVPLMVTLVPTTPLLGVKSVMTGSTPASPAASPLFAASTPASLAFIKFGSGAPAQI